MKRHFLRFNKFGLIIALVLVVALVSGCTVDPATRTEPPEAEAPSFDRYGGLKSVSTEKTGRFRTELIDGVWWLITPKGHGFFSAGMNNVSSTPDYAPDLGTYPYEDVVLTKYGSEEAWADATIARLKDWGFNTVGSWSDEEHFDGHMAFAPNLRFSYLAPVIPGSTGTGIFKEFAFPMRDYFDPSFAEGAAQYAEDTAGEWAGNPYCIGVFTDNEIPWGLSPIQGKPYVDAYLSLPAGSPGKLDLQEFFEERYNGRILCFNLAWGQWLRSFDDIQNLTKFNRLIALETPRQKADRVAFRERVATQYFEVVHDALRAVDPEMLILGPRFVSNLTAPDVYTIAGQYLDVVAVNCYQFIKEVAIVPSLLFAKEGLLFVENPWDDLDRVYELTGKPIMISEFGYRAAMPDGPPSDYPMGYPTFTTQQERADYYSNYMNEVYDSPYVVGTHWWQYTDQPGTGRDDELGIPGENNNWGVVDINDEVYIEVADAMRAMNNAVRVREAL